MKLCIFNLSTLLLCTFSLFAMDKEQAIKTTKTQWQPFIKLVTPIITLRSLPLKDSPRSRVQNDKFGYKPIESLEVIADTENPTHFTVVAHFIKEDHKPASSMAWHSKYLTKFSTHNIRYRKLDSAKWTCGKEEISSVSNNGIFRATVKNKKENDCLQVVDQHEVQIDWDIEKIQEILDTDPSEE